MCVWRRAQAKVLVFFSTCKQVKFAFEAFRRLRPGVPLRALHGKMKQIKRMAVFYEFSEAQVRHFDPGPRHLQPRLAAFGRVQCDIDQCGHEYPPKGQALITRGMNADVSLSYRQAMVLFATDVAARGLDFPTIDWVLQVRTALSLLIPDQCQGGDVMTWCTAS